MWFPYCFSFVPKCIKFWLNYTHYVIIICYDMIWKRKSSGQLKLWDKQLLEWQHNINLPVSKSHYCIDFATTTSRQIFSLNVSKNTEDKLFNSSSCSTGWCGISSFKMWIWDRIFWSRIPFHIGNGMSLYYSPAKESFCSKQAKSTLLLQNANHALPGSLNPSQPIAPCKLKRTSPTSLTCLACDRVGL